MTTADLRKSDSQLDAEAAANSAVRASIAEQTRYSPMVGRNQYSGVSLQDRFWEKVDRRSPDECWPWLAFRHYKVSAIVLRQKWKSVE